MCGLLTASSYRAHCSCCSYEQLILFLINSKSLRLLKSSAIRGSCFDLLFCLTKINYFNIIAFFSIISCLTFSDDPCQEGQEIKYFCFLTALWLNLQSFVLLSVIFLFWPTGIRIYTNESVVSVTNAKWKKSEVGGFVDKIITTSLEQSKLSTLT